MDNQQSVTPEKVITRLVNKLAVCELEEVKRDALIEDYKEKINQLTQANQKLQNENNQLREKGEMQNGIKKD